MKKPFGDSSVFPDFSDFSNLPVPPAACPATVFSPGAASSQTTPDPGPTIGSPILVPDEELEAEAAFAASGSGGTG
jgi:hypothetical protein